MWNDLRIQTQQPESEVVIVMHCQKLILQLVDERQTKLEQKLVSPLKESLIVLEEVLEG